MFVVTTFFARLIRIGLVGGVVLLLLFVTLAPFRLIKAAGTLPNGVAAGDITQASAVLWARGTTLGNVLFEYSTDVNFGSNVLSKNATVTNLLQPVKVEITGLSPATIYYYRVTDAAGASGQGQFRTAAAAGSQTGLRFGVSGDWVGSLAPYPSIANADERQLNFFIEHGDTIGAGTATTLDEYRLKHNEVYSTHHGLNTWADLRASTSILATIDDNDVQDNFAGGAHPSTDPTFDNTGNYINETVRYGNGLQAFQEYNPLRNELYGATGDARTANKRKLYRYNTYGSDAAVFILDTRSFRDKQLDALTDPNDTTAALEFLTKSLSETNRTLLGQAQLAELKANLQQAQADGITWKFILVSIPIQNLGLYKAEDRYEGYGAERTDLLKFINENEIDNVVFIAAGMHGTLVNNLTYQKSPPDLPLTVPLEQTKTSAFEVIVGPVAIDPPFGPAVVQLALDAGLITPAEKWVYDNILTREQKDDLIKENMDKMITPLGYDPIGLESGSGIEAKLLQGDYVAVHTYGWTEFEIGQSTQVLTVTTYGIDPYTEADLATNPNQIVNRTPTIISQFTVTPTIRTESPKQSVYLPIVIK